MSESKIYHYLSDRIKEAAFNQKEAAVKLGISPQYLSDILLGKRRITADMALKFERVCRYPARDILEWQMGSELLEARRRYSKKLRVTGHTNREWLDDNPASGKEELMIYHYLNEPPGSSHYGISWNEQDAVLLQLSDEYEQVRLKLTPNQARHIANELTIFAGLVEAKGRCLTLEHEKSDSGEGDGNNEME